MKKTVTVEIEETYELLVGRKGTFAVSTHSTLESVKAAKARVRQEHPHLEAKVRSSYAITCKDCGGFILGQQLLDLLEHDCQQGY